MATVYLRPGKGFIKDPETGTVYLIPGKGFFKSVAAAGGVALIAQARSASRFVFSRIFGRVN